MKISQFEFWYIWLIFQLFSQQQYCSDGHLDRPNSQLFFSTERALEATLVSAGAGIAVLPDNKYRISTKFSKFQSLLGTFLIKCEKTYLRHKMHFCGLKRADLTFETL